jgi:Epoxide hydrolase N terminus
MSEEINSNRRRFFGTAAMTFTGAQFGAFGSLAASDTSTFRSKASAGIGDQTIRPFDISVPEAALVDRSQGVQLATMKKLVAYWGTEYQWSKAEAKLNTLPQLVTTIDGLDIQFAHIRSRQPNAVPLIMTHGWPGSIFELLKVIGPLTDPTAYGGRAEDAFDLVLPSMPGGRKATGRNSLGASVGSSMWKRCARRLTSRRSTSSLSRGSIWDPSTK